MLRRGQHAQRLAGMKRKEYRRRYREQHIARNRHVQRACDRHHQHPGTAQQRAGDQRLHRASVPIRPAAQQQRQRHRADQHDAEDIGRAVFRIIGRQRTQPIEQKRKHPALCHLHQQPRGPHPHHHPITQPQRIASRLYRLHQFSARSATTQQYGGQHQHRHQQRHQPQPRIRRNQPGKRHHRSCNRPQRRGQRQCPAQHAFLAIGETIPRPRHQRREHQVERHLPRHDQQHQFSDRACLADSDQRQVGCNQPGDDPRAARLAAVTQHAHGDIGKAGHDRAQKRHLRQRGDIFAALQFDDLLRQQHGQQGDISRRTARSREREQHQEPAALARRLSSAGRVQALPGAGAVEERSTSAAATSITVSLSLSSPRAINCSTARETVSAIG